MGFFHKYNPGFLYKAEKCTEHRNKYIANRQYKKKSYSVVSSFSSLYPCLQLPTHLIAQKTVILFFHKHQQQLTGEENSGKH